VNRRTSSGLLAAAVAASAIAVAPAIAQDVPDTDISANVQVTPDKAGTKKNPRGVRINATAKITTEAGFDPPIVTGVDLLISQGVSWNGGDYVKCSKPVLDRQGPRGCPKESIMGTGIAVGRADTVAAHVKVTFVNGGETTLYAYATLDNPARVQETIVIKTENLTGKWRYRDTFRVPESLQVVAGVPIRLTSAKFELGGRPYAKNFLTTTSCPKGGWKYQATAHYLFDLTGQTSEDTIDGSVACTS
jgi:hypothetical protein